jgi:hypothetical protein
VYLTLLDRQFRVSKLTKKASIKQRPLKIPKLRRSFSSNAECSAKVLSEGYSVDPKPCQASYKSFSMPILDSILPKQISTIFSTLSVYKKCVVLDFGFLVP